MEDFYNKFRDKMQEYPRKETNWEMWKKVNTSLHRSRRFIYLPWIVGVLALLMGYLAGSSITRPENNSENNLTEYINETDTVFIEKTLIKYDTIFQSSKNNIPAFYNNNNSFRNKLLIAENELLKNNLIKLTTKYNNTITQLESFLDQETGKNKNQPRFAFGKGKDIEKSSEFLSSNTFDLEKYNLNYLQNKIEERKLIINPLSIHTPKIKNNYLSKLSPDYYDAGLQLNIPEFIFQDGYDRGFSYGLTFISDLIFSPKISIRTGIGFNVLNSKTEDQNTFNLYTLPDVPSDYSLKEIYINEYLLQIPLFLKYNFYHNKNFSIFGLAGTSINIPVASNNIFEFKQNGEEIKLKDEHQNSGDLTINPSIGIGVEYQFSRQWKMYSDLYGNIGIKTSETMTYYPGIGLHLGGMYAF